MRRIIPGSSSLAMIQTPTSTVAMTQTPISTASPSDNATADTPMAASSDDTAPASRPKSWVWTYFIVASDSKKVQCTATKADGTICNALLARDASRSTKSMIEHLHCMHKIQNPDKALQNQPI